MTQSTARFLRLLGPTRIEYIRKTQAKAAREDIIASPRFRSRLTMALLGYLVIEKRPVSRDFLASLFWPDEPSTKGRANLRRELHNLSQVMPGCWVTDRQSAEFVPSVDTGVDIYMLLDLQMGGHWIEAAELLGGIFLEGVHLDSNLEFENWLMVERERWRKCTETVLTKVVERHTLRGHYSDALHHSQHLLKVAPWNENTHRQVMRLLALTGQRAAALRQFESCKDSLWQELSVLPSSETVILYQKIYNGEIKVPTQLPAFLLQEEARYEIESPRFVAREREMSQMFTYLNAALDGRGRVIFITGDPGSGKTALLNAFANKAMEVHQELLVINGNCNAHSGLGDPYLPFRDAMGMLTGDVEAKWDAGAITREHAQRLWVALPLVTQILLDYGTHLLDLLIPGAALLSRVLISEQVNSPEILRLRQTINIPNSNSQDIIDKNYLFQQVTDVLQRISLEMPLFFIIDDIQWADTASIDLLFHLGRRLSSLGSRVLIACAYRPEEVAIGRSGGRHPMAKTLSEFKRIYGKVWVELGETPKSEDRKFVDGLLESIPNQLSDDFREALLERTEGHPLFTVELLHAMQERGDLIRDEKGNWIEAKSLDWKIIPARVEAVIKERIDRLSPELQDILAIASVEGEVFTAQVLTDVQNIAEGPLLHWLSSELGKRHRLVREFEEVHTGKRWLSRYRFSHVLFQEYVYRQLSLGQRRLLHREIATSIERLYAGKHNEMAVHLSHHFSIAGDYSRALPYLKLAAERAAQVHAYDESIKHYTRAIELADTVSIDALLLAEFYRGRGLALKTLGKFESARRDMEAALKIAHSVSETLLEWRLHIDMGKLWSSRDYNRSYQYFTDALDISRRLNEPTALAGSLNWVGNWYANDEKPIRSVKYHLEALEIFESLADQQGLAKTLDLLGIANLLGADLTSSVKYYDRAIELFQKLDDRPRLASSLMGRGTITSLTVLLANAPADNPPDGLRDIQEARRIVKEIHSPTEEAWAHWTLGLLYIVHGRYGPALEIIESGLQISTELGHREWEVGNRFALGKLYMELFSPVDARLHLEKALTLANGLQSSYWKHHIIGALAGACLLLNDFSNAEAYMEGVLFADRHMDTMGKRYCWVRAAELAIAQGNPRLALDITERLIASAPGVQTGAVITFLWMLQGQASMDLGFMEESITKYQAAKENACNLGERFLLWRIHSKLHQLYDNLGRQTEAKDEYCSAQKLIDELASTIPNDEYKNNFLQGANRTLNPTLNRER